MTEKINYCLVCRKNMKFAECESPSGYEVCTACGFRQSTKRKKLVINQFGYTFQEE